MLKASISLAASIFMLSSGVLAEVVDRDGIVRDDRGNVPWMDNRSAIEACAKHGMRLPTLRELLGLYRSAGLEILEPNEVGDGAIRYGYVERIDSFDPDGKFDRFYLHRIDPGLPRYNYKRPLGDTGNFAFWSSSVTSVPSGVSFIFDAPNGGVFHPGDHGFSSYARCISR
jgi:hypothetical protein